MFSNRLPFSSILFSVSYKDFARNHYLKDFEKKYKGKQWEKTEQSFFEDLKRLRVENNTIQFSSQIDQLKHKGDYWLFKYDFRIAGSKESTKTSGNRIIGLIDNRYNKIEILLIYAKTDLPKNTGVTSYIEHVIKETYPDIAKLFL